MASHSADLLRAACAAYAHEHHSDCDRPSQLGRPRHCQHDSSDTTATHLPRRSGRGWKSPSITDSPTTPEIQPPQSTPGATDIAYSRRSNAAPRRHHSSSGITGQVISAAKCCCSWSYRCCRVHATSPGFRSELSGKLFRINWVPDCIFREQCTPYSPQVTGRC